MTIKVLLKIYFCLLVVKIATVSGEFYYVPNFTGIRSCADFDNDAINMDDVDIDSDYDEETETKGVGITGPIKLKKALDDMYDLELSVTKETEAGDELAFSSRANLCSSLKSDDAPWEPMMKQLGISSCPIEADTYQMKQVTMSLDPFEDYLDREYCGSYDAKIEIVNGRDTVACYLLGIMIEEIEIKDE